MELMLIIAAMLFGSVALGFALNRFVLVRITPGPIKAIALAASRAVFYAPSLVGVGHGGPFPSTLLLIGVAYLVREFRPELDERTFLLPIVVFLGSLALSWSKRFGLWFCALAAAHLTLFWVLPFTFFSSFDARLAWFAVNGLPLYPLEHLNLPITRSGWLTMPNALGWVWCLAVWVILYGSLAMALTRLTARLTRMLAKAARAG
jgi:hypothetical protein